MSSHRPSRLDRSTAERLLSGDQATTDTHADTATALLAVALSVAAAPAHPDELAGENRVLAAYTNSAQLGPDPESRRQSMFKSALAKVLTVKAAIVVAALGASGVALAASTGALPTPWSDTPANPPATSRAATPTAPPSADPTGKPADAGSDATPSPSTAGLCEAYTAQVGEDPGKALDSPAFKALVDAAGSKDNVPAYCDTLTKEHGKPTDLPTPTAPGNGNAPTTRPTPPEAPAPSNRPVTPTTPAHPTGAKPPTQG